MDRAFEKLLLLVVLVATAALTSCGNSSQDWDEWEAQYMRPLAQAIPARFWVREEWYSRIPDVMEHPCGGVIEQRVTAIPQFAEDSPFAVSPVVEVNAEGDVLARWGLPLEAQPLDIAGEWLLVQLAGEQMAPVWIGPNGEVRGSHDIPEDWGNPPYVGVCPAENLQFDPWCISLDDRHDKSSRLLVAETICT